MRVWRQRKKERKGKAGVFLGLSLVFTVWMAGNMINAEAVPEKEGVTISTVEEFNACLLDRESPDYDLSGTYILAADLNLSGMKEPVGSQVRPFTGTFYGNDHVISGIRMPLFGALDGGASVDGVVINSAKIEAPVLTGTGGGYFPTSMVFLLE